MRILLYILGSEQRHYEDLYTELEHEGHNVSFRNLERFKPEQLEAADQVMVPLGVTDIASAYRQQGVKVRILEEVARAYAERKRTASPLRLATDIPEGEMSKWPREEYD